MKKLTTVLALTLLAAGAAMADDITIDNTPFTSTKTRAEVRAELFAARADGSAMAWADNFSPLMAAAPAHAQSSVADYLAGTARAERVAGYAAVMIGEDSGSFALSRMPAARVAGPVFAGLTRQGH